MKSAVLRIEEGVCLEQHGHSVDDMERWQQERKLLICQVIETDGEEVGLMARRREEVPGEIQRLRYVPPRAYQLYTVQSTGYPSTFEPSKMPCQADAIIMGDVGAHRASELEQI